jgi:hypothetical protein
MIKTNKGEQMRLAKEINNLLPVYEMANLDFRDTGIPKVFIHVYSQGNKEVGHGPRIKVSNVYGKFRNDDCFVIDILNQTIVEGTCKIKPFELIKIQEWIRLNKKLLLRYWKRGIVMATRELTDNLIKLNTK